MSRRKSPSSSRRRRVFVFQTLEDRRVLAATTPDVVELTNTLGPNVYSGAFEQRTTVAPQYVTDAQGNRAIDLRVDVPGDQTVWLPSIGVNDAGPYGIEQSRQISRVMVRPNQRYVIEHRYNESGIPISAFDASGALIARLILATDPSDTDDQNNDVIGRYLAYIGDINWSDAPALKLPPTTTSIVFAQGDITSIGFLDDFAAGASKTATWGSEPLYTSSKSLDLAEADDPIPINGTKQYRLEATVSSVGDATQQSVGYTAYDRDGLLIEPQHVSRYLIAVDTTLARELKAGDTSIELTDATGWSNLSSDPNTRALAWYGYRDANGNTYDDYSYTRNVASSPGLGLWTAGAITGNRIALRQPWSGPTLASGTAVRNAVTGNPLFSVLADDALPPLSRAVDITGFWRNGAQSNTSFPPATAIIRPAAELNHALTFSGTTRLSYRFRVASQNSLTSFQSGNSRSIQIDVLANDPSLGNAPQITSVTAPKFGTVQIVNDLSLGRQTLNYTSAPFFVGVDRFTYTVTNGAGVSFTEQVSVSSLGSNLESNPGLNQAIVQTSATAADEIRWVASNSTVYHVLQGAELNVSGGGTPLLLEGLGSGTLPKFVSLERPPEHGSFKMEPNGAFRYIADATYSGKERIELRVSNGVRTRFEIATILIGGSSAEVDQGKLGQIGGALESGVSAFRRYFYPSNPAYFDANNKPFLSWRVHALPYLGFQALYDRFHLNEPWDSPNNLPLASQMPDIFRSWGEVGGNLTRFQTIQAGQPSSAHWIDSNGAPHSNQSYAIHGELNSILVLQTNAANAVVWTKPDDLVFTDPQATLAKLTAPLFPAYFWHSSRVNFDAILVPQDIPASQFHSIATINETSGALGVDVASLARGWAERADTPLTAEQYAIPKTDYNIQVLAIAFNNYEAAFRFYPKSGTASPTGQPLLSWRVQLLPYLGLGELYSRFKQDEPWDSPTNLALLNQMPDVFRSGLDPSTSNTTRFRVLDGVGTAYDGTKTRIRKSDFFNDGLSNTILFAEAGVDKAVPWTQPEAIAIDMANIWPALGSFPDGYMRIGLGDTSVGKLGTAAPNADIAALLTTGLRVPAVRADEELYDARTLMERSGFPTPISARANLFVLSSASENFNNTYKVLPPNGYGALFNGTSPTVLLSWRVSLLPFLEASRLFSKFKLDEAWDSPNNLALMKYMPYYLKSVGDPVNTTNTRLQSFVGSNSFVNSANKKLRLSDLTKGPANTLAYVQTGIDKMVPWTKPADVNAEAPDIWKELGRVGQSARFSSIRQNFNLNRNLPATLFSRTLSEAVNVNETYPRTIIQSNTLVIREGDFARVDSMMFGTDDIMEMDSQSFLTMTSQMTFAAAENIDIDGTRKVQVRWGKRSNPADPTSPLIVTQTLDVYVIDNEPLLLGTGPRVVSENGDIVQFFISRATAPANSLAPDLNSPLTVTIASDSPNRIQLPSTVVIPAGEAFAVFTGTTIDNSNIEGPITVRVVASAPGRLDSLTQVSIADDDALQIRINPSTINERDGSTIGTVTRLGGSVDQPLAVRLSSSNTSIAQVPSIVVIPAGSASASFTITAIRDAGFDGVQVVRITAEVGDYQRSTASLTVYDIQPLQMQLTSNSISEAGGRTTIVVFRSGVPVDQPMVIQLHSSDTSELTVPATVTIPANEQSVRFDAIAVDDQLLDGMQTVTVTASSNAYDAGEVSINVSDQENLTLSFIESTISENGKRNSGRVTRSNTDIEQPLVVSLLSTVDPALRIPTSVVIPAGVSFVDFEVRTIDDSLLNGTRGINVEAASAGYFAAASAFRITDDEQLRLSVDRTTLSEHSEKTTARLTRSNTDIDQSLPIFLAWDSSIFFVNNNAAVVIPAGSAFVDFTIETRDNRALTGTQQFTIGASHPDYISAAVQIVVTDYEELSVLFEQPVVPENGYVTQALLSRGDWNDLSQPLTVQIRTNSTGLVSVPASVTIPAGAPSVYFPVTTIDDDILTVDGKNVIVEAVHPGYVTIAGELSIADFETLTIEFDQSQVAENGLAHGRVVRSNTNTEHAITVELQALTPGFFRTPLVVEIPAGSAFGVFTIESLDNATLNDSSLVQIVAENPYYQSRGSWIEVIGDEPLDFSLSAAEQLEGTSITATVTRNVDDVSQEAIVYIAISDSTQLIAPDFIVIPANERTANFILELPRDRIRDGDKQIDIELHSDGYVTAKAFVNTLDLESLWHNPRLSLDVNDDGVVSPLDALLVINFLNTARGPVSQLVRPGLGPLFLDTSNEGVMSPLDALLVINELNRRANGEGESSEPPAGGTAVDQALWELEEEKLAVNRPVSKENGHLRGKFGFTALTKLPL